MKSFSVYNQQDAHLLAQISQLVMKSVYNQQDAHLLTQYR